MKAKKLVLVLGDPINCFPHTNYIDTLNTLNHIKMYNNLGLAETVFTTQSHFLSFKYAERLFVTEDGSHCYEITLGKCEGTNRFITEKHNLEKLLFSGEFSWFDRKGEFR